MGFELLMPLVYTLTSLLKRFIPKKHKGTLTPLASLATGVGVAWLTGGHTMGLEVLGTGLAAGASAVVGYDVLKSAGKAATGDR